MSETAHLRQLHQIEICEWKEKKLTISCFLLLARLCTFWCLDLRIEELSGVILILRIGLNSPS